MHQNLGVSVGGDGGLLIWERRGVLRDDIDGGVVPSVVCTVEKPNVVYLVIHHMYLCCNNFIHSLKSLFFLGFYLSYGLCELFRTVK